MSYYSDSGRRFRSCRQLFAMKLWCRPVATTAAVFDQIPINSKCGFVRGDLIDAIKALSGKRYLAQEEKIVPMLINEMKRLQLIDRGYTDGFTQWCKQVIGLCLTAFLQATILVAGLMVFSDKALLGLGLMLAAGEVPRIAGAFGLDTTTRANIMSAVYTAQAAVNTTRTIVQAVK